MPMEPSPTTQTWKALTDATTIPPGLFLIDGLRTVSGRWPDTNASNHRQADVDIVTGGIGIRADIVGFLDQVLGLLLVHTRHRDAQRHIQTETTFRTRANADIRGD